MTTCSQYKKVTLITDPLNPEQDLVDRVTSLGETVYKEDCSDGFIYLIRIPDAVVDVPSIVE